MHKQEEKAYLVLLYYYFTPIEDPESFREEHHALCLSLNLRGRIIIASEGLNGTVSGEKADCERYMEAVRQDPRFSDIDFKAEAHHSHSFEKLHVRVKREIVHAGLPHIKPYERTGTHLSPAEFKALKDQQDVVVVDMRSNYEHQLGKFKNAITLDMENFRELPEQLEHLEAYKDKKVITYCTGGIKCEKASAYLLEQGFKDVYQLHGGIIKYGLEMGGEDFEGKCYVFDGRVATDVNHVNPEVISYCFVCGTPSDNMVNCAHTKCNRHAPICPKCMEEMEGCCSQACKESPDRRPYNPQGYYPRQSNGYNPVKHSRRRQKNKEESDSHDMQPV